MKLFNSIPMVRTSLTALATLVLVTGCHSSKQKTYAYSGGNVPVVATAEQPQPQPQVAAGAPGPGFETQAGAGQAGATTTSQNDIVVPLQKENVTIGTQPVNEGTIRVHKVIRTETVNQPVQIRREVVTVDRQPAGAQAAANPSAPAGAPLAGAQTLGTPFQEGEITIPLTREQPVIQTQVVPAGSVVIHKQTVTEPMTVQGQARSEDVEVAKLGNAPGATTSPSANPPGAQGGAPGAQGGAPGLSGQSAGANTGGAGITQLNQLYSTSDPASLAGRQVNLSGVAIMDVPGDHLIVVGPASAQSVCIHTAQSTKGLSKGQTVNINGTVKSTPQSMSEMGLDQSSAAQMQNQPIYVDAATITPANQ